MTIEDTARRVATWPAQMPRGLVQLERDGDVGIISLDHPATRHALSEALLADLDDAVSSLSALPVEALVLTATGRVFSAGGDLAGVAQVLDEAVDEAAAVAGVARLVDQLHEVVRRLRRLHLPVVAAVNGPAVGAGISLAMVADVRVLAAGASFVPGYLAVGATPDGGASYHLGRAFGGPQALSAFLMNRRLDAERLLDSGLADVVVPVGEDLVTRAVEVARQLVALSTESLVGIRALLDGADGHGFDVHLDAEREWFLRVSQTSQFRASVHAFGGKPSPATTPYPA